MKTLPWSRFLFFFSYYFTFAKASNCEKGIVESGVDRENQNFIVDKHNELRKLIANGLVDGQPKGINLKKISWDDDLADEAQRISDTCKFAHVTVVDDRWSWIGQNLYTWVGSHSKGPSYVADGQNWNSSIMSWFNEHKDFVYPTGRGAGHYTQVAWADTTHIGCGYTSFVTNKDHKRKIYVCNYAPGGNYIGEAPYETGQSGCENLC